MPATDLERLIPLQHAFNFRDLGGYRTLDGRSVRWRTLFRADGLHRLDASDIQRLTDLGLRTVIDLRTADEVAAGRFPVDALPVTWHHLSVLDVLWDPEHAPADPDAYAEFLFGRYLEILVTGGAHFASAVTALAEPQALPAVFHCAAGKDRTGLLAALVLSSLGVPDGVVMADYALSQDAMDRLRTWAADFEPELAARIDAQPAAHLAAHPDAMRRVLEWLRAEHGSPAGFLESLGVAPHTLAALADAVLAGDAG